MFLFFLLIVCTRVCVYVSLGVGQTQSSVFTIDGNSAIQTNFTNSAYVSTEGTAKTSTSNDGLPSYEEAIGVTVKGPIASQSIPTIEVVNEDVSRDVDDSGGGGGSGVGGASTGCSGRRHRHRRHHHRLNSDRHNENSEPNATEGESRRNRHRRGFRKHLAKIKRRHHTETE